MNLLKHGCSDKKRIIKAGVNYDNQTQEGFSHRCRIYRSNNGILISAKELADVVLVDIPQLENQQRESVRYVRSEPSTRF